MSNRMSKALCYKIDAIWLFPVWFPVYERSAVKQTCRQGGGTSILEMCEVFHRVDAQDGQSWERCHNAGEIVFKSIQLKIFFLQGEDF